MSLASRLEVLKEKPEEERRRLAFLLAACVTIVIALTWLASGLTRGIFAIKGASFAEATSPQGSLEVAPAAAPSPMAAAAAVLGVSQKPAAIKIIDSESATSGIESAPQSEPTVIPF